METMELSEAADDSSGNSGIIKSENGSPDHGTGRGSPPPNCAICLGRCRNKSFTDSCLHQFCFKCLLTWSRVKTECPLCKQNFKSIIHNVKSNHQYEEYPVQQPESEVTGPNLDLNDIMNSSSRFRYRTTLTLPRRETLAIRQFLMHYPLSALVNDLPQRERTRRAPPDFRRTVYRHNLWARPLPDFTGRFRDCSPEFFRYNDSQVHRLVPWLNRELFYLLNENNGHVTYVMGRILELLSRHPILSAEFRSELHRFLGERTDHFLHEFHCFASTPYDITGYDRHVQYQTTSRLTTPAGPLVSEVLSSSDSDSHDSDIVMVSSSRAATPPPAPAPAPAPPTVVPIETISHSDTDSDSEVMVVGYIKPPHQRTPELVDLLASDSDVLVQEEEPPPPPATDRVQSLVRFELAVHRDRADSSDNEPQQSSVTQRRMRRPRLIPPAPPYEEECVITPVTPIRSTSSDSSESSSRSVTEAIKKRALRRKPRKKKSASLRLNESKREADDKVYKRIKGKSRNGKDVKCSTVEPRDATLPPTEISTTALDLSRASALGENNTTKKNDEHALYDSGPSCSGLNTHKKKRSSDSVSRHRTRDTRETKRLKSIVKVMKRISEVSGAETSESRAVFDSSASTSSRRPKTRSPSVDSSRRHRTRSPSIDLSYTSMRLKTKSPSVSPSGSSRRRKVRSPPIRANGHSRRLRTRSPSVGASRSNRRLRTKSPSDSASGSARRLRTKSPSIGASCSGKRPKVRNSTVSAHDSGVRHKSKSPSAGPSGSGKKFKTRSSPVRASGRGRRLGTRSPSAGSSSSDDNIPLCLSVPASSRRYVSDYSD